MGYRIGKNESIEPAVRRIAVEQIDKAVGELTDDELSYEEAVHQARKRFKKIRGELRLARGSLGDAYGRENTWFRDLGRELSVVRDAQVMVETFDKLRDAFDAPTDAEALAPIREALAARAERVAEERNLKDRCAEVIDELRDARDRVEKWTLSAAGFDALAPGLRKTYRRARKALPAAYEQLTDEAFHEWRKRVKYHWYHMRLLREAWPRPMKARRRAVKDLADLLGDDHDLALFRRLLRERGEALGDAAGVRALLGLAERRQAELRAAALPLGRRIFTEKPGRFVERIATWWRADPDQPPEVLTVRGDEEAACS